MRWEKEIGGGEEFQLWLAARDGDLEEVGRLLQSGVDPKSCTADGFTALHYASGSDSANSRQICEMLLNAGANVNAINALGVSPIHNAATRNFDVLECLLDNGADIHAEDKKQRMALHYACAVGNVANVRKLILRNAYTRARDIDGNTPLHLAAITGNEDVLRSLIQGFALISVKNLNGQTPLDCCSTHGPASETLQRASENDGVHDRSWLKKIGYTNRPISQDTYMPSKRP